jgi:cyclic pyranopterin phosphate synthase
MLGVGANENQLQDTFGRRFSYLRLSITDACNFRCVYCLPHGYQKPADHASPLSISEIENVVRAFAEMGTTKVRLTGGEPTLRRDLIEIMETVSSVPGIKSVGISTNGNRLKQLAPLFRRAGVDALNISIDSLNRKRFSEITGVDALPEIIEGVESALRAGFARIKINAVLLGGWNEEDFLSFQDWIKIRPITVRFIELMPTGQNQELFKKHQLKGDFMRQKLLETGWTVRQRSETDGPAAEFEHPDFVGKMGVIAPYSTDFCATCNRLRISSTGGLRLCLFGEGNHSIRHLLGSSLQREDLKNEVRALLGKKEISHYLPEGRYGNNQSFSQIGG